MTRRCQKNRLETKQYPAFVSWRRPFRSARAFGMETDAKNGPGGGNCGYTGSCCEPKMEIPVDITWTPGVHMSVRQISSPTTHETKKPMKTGWWIRASQLAAITLILSFGAAAQTGDPAAIQQKLYTQFKLTTITADRSDIVTAGDVVAIQKPGLIMYATASPMPPSNTYKNGRIGQGWGGFGKDMLITMAAPGGATATDYPHRPFVPDEKCWVTGIQVQRDGVLFQLYSDPYDNIRYYATLKIPFPNKKEVPSVDTAMQLVAEVLTVVPSDQAAPDQGNQGGQPAQSAQPAGTAVQYVVQGGGGGRLILLPGGSFSLLAPGGVHDSGQYSVSGDTLTLTYSTGGRTAAFKIQGDNLSADTGQLWVHLGAGPPLAPASEAAATPAAAPAPAPMAEIPPPPPPTDTPPPTIAIGQTMDQVTTAFGAPLKVAKLGAKTIFYYKDMKVTFTNGKVTDVE